MITDLKKHYLKVRRTEDAAGKVLSHVVADAMTPPNTVEHRIFCRQTVARHDKSDTGIQYFCNEFHSSIDTDDSSTDGQPRSGTRRSR